MNEEENSTFENFIRRKPIVWDKEDIVKAFKDLEEDLINEHELKEWLKDKEKVAEEELNLFLDEQDIEWIGDEYNLYAWLKAFITYNYGVDKNILQYFDFDKYKKDLIKESFISTITINGIDYYIHYL